MAAPACRSLRARFSLGVAFAATLGACNDAPSFRPVERSVHSLANRCVSLSVATSRGERYLLPTADGNGFTFASAALASASRFVARASDLGTFIFRDPEGEYPVAADDGSGIARTERLFSDVTTNDDTYVSPSEWILEADTERPGRFVFRNRATSAYLGRDRMVTELASAARVAVSDTTQCTPFPELSLDATGSVTRTQWEDGDLFGFVDAHSHLFTNVGFGYGGTFHGAPFHRLGVEHALPDCEPFHGGDGRRDLMGYFYRAPSLDADTATSAVLLGETPEFNHYTAGYPQFTDWPNSWRTDTHQTQYYRWIERAYLSGLRLIVQHATSNQVLCEFMTGIGVQTRRISCSELESSERTIDEVYALERYVDAQSGGPGLGWFRVVTSPAQARQVIASGKLAVVLGIETSNLFDCLLTPPPGVPRCDEATVRERLAHFHDRGVRVMFPVHKFDNAFSAGDGHRGFIELGNIISSGHYSNFTTDCPNVPAPFDRGGVVYGGLNQPRVQYDAAPVIDVSGFGESPLGVLFELSSLLDSTPLAGNYCQTTGLTALGEFLITEMMHRGMVLEIDHLPQRGYARALEMLVENDYPAAGTHGSNANGLLYELGGISVMGLPRCGNPNDPNAAANQVRGRIAEIVARGGYPAQGFGFDLNGFAGGPRPRFGADAPCGQTQTDPITYPFTSYAGDVVFEEPRLGERAVDFNTEGMLHLGLVPELIEDARHLGVTDADLEPLFRSAEGYIRMWERAEARGAILRAAAGN